MPKRQLREVPDSMGRGEALIYCRVSTIGQEQDGTSLDSQEAAGRAHAETLGYTVGRVSREVCSGATFYEVRPALKRDLADIRAGQFQAVIIHDTDRLSRDDPVCLLMFVRECDQAGAAFISVLEPNLDLSDEGQLLLYVKGFNNKRERAKILERTLRGKRQRALNGKVHTEGPDKYGYGRDKAAGKRVIKEDEAVIIRQIYQMIAYGGHSFRSAAKALDEQGIPTPGRAFVQEHDPGRVASLHWDATTIARIIRNPLYKGETWEWMYQRQADMQGKRPADQWIRLPDGVTPAIVDETLWEAAQVAVQQQSGDHTRNTKSWQYLLRGLVFCGVCGMKMWPNWRRRVTSDPTSPQLRVYRCSSYQSHAGFCGGGAIRADEVEAWAWEHIAAIIRDPDLVAAEMKRHQEEGPDPAIATELATAQRKIAECDRQLQRLVDKYVASTDESMEPFYERRKDELKAEKEQWTRRAKEAEQYLTHYQHAQAGLEALYAMCARIAENLETFTFEEKREALEAFDIRITGNGYDWTLRGYLPNDEPFERKAQADGKAQREGVLLLTSPTRYTEHPLRLTFTFRHPAPANTRPRRAALASLRSEQGESEAEQC